MKPISLEVISLIPGLLATWFDGNCVSDQLGLKVKDKRDNRDLNEYPEDVKEDYLYLSSWIKELSQKYREKILIRITDAQSLQGFYKSIRYRAFRYPAFIINNKKKYTGTDKVRLDLLLREELGNAWPPVILNAFWPKKADRCG